ncbi:phosphotransferase family protein [Actinomadura rudentiformis]|uniref:Phosphotransferase n=1 Tax=Actinomadura rudentiformis TaxID=359158 RepID=A0A6H9YUH0_9ACTN|nr:phosphotransferase [Actinomadura rudentiformis]KAB2349446.1 phosphotransferase [Actinomadura rudentiformis]
MPSTLLASLADLGRTTAGPAGVQAEAEVVYDRHSVLVVRVGDVVVKAHQPDRDGGPLLQRRMEVAAGLPDLLLPPLGPRREIEGRVVTVWPYGTPVDPAGPLPWEDGGRLLATLHSGAVPVGAPGWGRPARVARLVSRLEDGPSAAEIRRAFATLPSWIRGETAEPEDGARCLIHGDWHLGQMVRDASGAWRLIDVEDLGVGDPAWDLARPAALFSAGVLPPEDWERLLGAYRAEGGPAVPVAGDPWAALDIPARTLVIQIAATCVISAWEGDRPLEEPEIALVDACRRISTAGIPA